MGGDRWCWWSPLRPARCALLVLVLVLPAARPAPLDILEPLDTNTTSSPAPPAPPCHEMLSAQIGPDSVQLKDGSLRTPEGHTFPLGTYYTTEEEVRGCACQAGICFFKCCPWGRVMNSLKKTCEASDRAGHPFLLDLFEAGNSSSPPPPPLSLGAAPPPPEWIVMTGRPSDTMFRLRPETWPDDQFYLLSDATLLVPKLSRAPYPPASFCMDVFDDTGNVSALVMFESGEDLAIDSLEKNGYMYIIYPMGLLISLPFLMATFVVYAVLSELRNIHGKSLMCHVGAMIAGYVALVLVQIKVGIDNILICKSLGFFIQFSFLACFFWLNVMCFDIWWTFSGFRAMRGTPSERERHKFWVYSLYAWGGPLVILAVTVGLHLGAEANALPAAVVRPLLGALSCYFDSREARFAYFVGPVSALLLCNVLLFLHTAIRILQLRRETRALKSADSQRHNDDQQRYNVYLKLFVIMGVNWIAEIVSGFFPEYSYVWIITDVGNSLQGIFIFIMFVGTGRVRRLLSERLPALPGRGRGAGGAGVAGRGARSNSNSRAVNSQVTSNASTKSTRAVSTASAASKLNNGATIPADKEPGQQVDHRDTASPVEDLDQD